MTDDTNTLTDLLDDIDRAIAAHQVDTRRHHDQHSRQRGDTP